MSPPRFDNCICLLKSKTLCIYRYSPSSSSQFFQNNEEFGVIFHIFSIFTDQGASNTIQLSVPKKGIFSGLFFF